MVKRGTWGIETDRKERQGPERGVGSKIKGDVHASIRGVSPRGCHKEVVNQNGLIGKETRASLGEEKRTLLWAEKP